MTLSASAVDRLRPATPAEALAMQFAQNVKYEPGHPEEQQAFVGARALLNHDGDQLVDDPPKTDLLATQMLRKHFVP